MVIEHGRSASAAAQGLHSCAGRRAEAGKVRPAVLPLHCLIFPQRTAPKSVWPRQRLSCLVRSARRFEIAEMGPCGLARVLF